MRSIKSFTRNSLLALWLALALALPALAEDGGIATDLSGDFVAVDPEAAESSGEGDAYPEDGFGDAGYTGEYTQVEYPDADMTDADLVIGYVAPQMASMNPSTCTELSLISINQLMFESLVDLDANQRPVPMLADSWEQEGKTWTFRLRSGIQFHNGMELTAYDVVRSYETFITGYANSPYYNRLLAIASMEATDILTLQVVGVNGGIETLYAMTFPIMQYNTLADAYPRGTGPYWFIQRDANDNIRLEANPLWWKRQPGIHSIVCRRFDDAGDAIEAIHTRKIDMLSTISPNAAFSRKLKDVTNMDYVTTTYEMLLPNLSERSMMADLRARQVVMYAIDRSVIASNAYLDMAVQCEVPIPPSSWLYESQSAFYYYSPERALQLMFDLGWYDLTGNGKLNKVDGMHLLEPNITIVTYNESTNSIRENAANLIAQYLEAIGFNVTVSVHSQARVRELIKSRMFDLALIGVNLSEVPNLMPMFGRNEVLNFNGFGNDNMQSYLENAQVVTDEDTLRKLYSEMQLYIVNRLPILGLLFRTGTVLSNRSMGGMSALRYFDAFNGLEFLTPEG